MIELPRDNELENADNLHGSNPFMRLFVHDKNDDIKRRLLVMRNAIGSLDGNLDNQLDVLGPDADRFILYLFAERCSLRTNMALATNLNSIASSYALRAGTLLEGQLVSSCAGAIRKSLVENKHNDRQKLFNIADMIIETNNRRIIYSMLHEALIADYSSSKFTVGIMNRFGDSKKNIWGDNLAVATKVIELASQIIRTRINDSAYEYAKSIRYDEELSHENIKHISESLMSEWLISDGFVEQMSAIVVGVQLEDIVL